MPKVDEPLPPLSYKAVSSKESETKEDFYKKTLARLEKIQSHLDTAPRSSRLKGKVCIITGAGSLKGIG